jgi:hypothetical protein
MFVYLNEADKFVEFNDEKYLVWKLENIEYGSWIDGLNGDGSFIKTAQIDLTPVS